MRVGQGLSSITLLVVGACFLTAGTLAPRAKYEQRAKVSFSRDVLPILSDKCFKCHGPDAESRRANMRLDTPEGAFSDRGGKWPIVPGKPEDSLVVQRINHVDTPMPPKTCAARCPCRGSPSKGGQ